MVFSKSNVLAGLPARWVCVFAVMAVLAGSAGQAVAQWPGWGGPDRDFHVASSGLSTHWSAEGPKQIWSRKLGPGFSGIAAEDGVIYTMYRDGDAEVTIALDAKTGKTLWEDKVNMPVPEDMTTRFGKGPRTTPLVYGDRLFTLGVAGRLACLTRSNGKMRWSHDLMKKYNAKVPGFGFAASPVIHDGLLIVAAGGKGTGVMAFSAKTGSLKWKNFDYGEDESTGSIYSSPLIIDVEGEKQGVLLTGVEVIGFDPATGALKWKHAHENQWKTSISTPVWGDDNMLYVTAGGEAGSLGLKLTRSGDKTVVKEVWAAKEMKVGKGNVIRVGDHVYGSGGKFLSSASMKTGEIGFKDRAFANAMMLYADEKFIVLDEDGKLTIAQAKSDGIKSLGEKKLLTKPAWTIPTLVGKTLFLRDTETIMAIDLGGEGSKGT